MVRAASRRRSPSPGRSSRRTQPTSRRRNSARSSSRRADTAMIKPLVGPAQRFDAGLGDDGKIRVEVWDRFSSWGPKTKGGSESDFNETTLGQMVDNWRARGGRLSMCQDHKSAATPYVSAPGLAFYDAL